MEKNNLKTRKKIDWTLFITMIDTFYNCKCPKSWKSFGEVVDDKMILNKYGEIENVGNLVVLRGSLQKKWLSSVVWAFKTTSSKLIHKLWLKSFKRQKSFYDHIIRNENDMNRIIEYIELNPYAWENDEYYR